jgi:mannosyl-oligosaccharide alpha-1,3-glucosidase
MRSLEVIVCLSIYTITALAVDRSKFRTCDQTSFCRRHRAKASGSLYRYKLLPESLHFHIPLTAGTDEEASSSASSSSSLWKSFSSRILGSKEEGNKLDPYVRGAPPTLTGTLQNMAIRTEYLQWSVHAMADGLVRIRIHEIYGSTGKPWEHARVTYDELVLMEGSLLPAHHAQWIRAHDSENETVSEEQKSLLQKVIPKDDDITNYTGLQYGDHRDSKDNMLLLIRFEPFTLFLYRESSLEVGPIITLNTQEMMHFEIRRLKNQDPSKLTESPQQQEVTKEEEKKPEKEIVGYWEDGLAIYADGTREEKKVIAEEEEENHRKLTEASDLDERGMWEETFSSHTDSKPRGPMSVGMDISFPKSHHIFGIPEHASSTELKSTQGEGAHYQQPYRLYNLDVFEYELDETMALYGHVPLIVSHSLETGTSGAFYFNPTETFVDITSQQEGKSTHWISESGIIDVFLLPGSTPTDLYRQYAKITGTMPLPPMFSLGYHQCRWNYKDEKDVFYVHDTFEELDYPYDVLWLDIEHTHGKRYFTWDNNLFPRPKKMINRLWSQGRRMVTIIDPHIFRDDAYRIHKDATAKGLYIKDKEGKNDFDGWCWPGSSSYLDFTSEKVRNWWADQFSYDRYKGSTPSLFTWNDMNEPSVFNGPEVSMQKDLLNLNGEEHREWHNLYGMLFHKSTGMGLVRRNKPNEDIRPFVLSRAFFAGSQRYGAIWTGDNLADWSHLEISNPMLLSLNVAALSFVGADVGGFFGNPDAELITRWMQAGSYQPFFRGHAHHDSKRREPWMFGDETMRRLRATTMKRYALLPMWYTVFYEAGVSGMPVMRTMWMQYPKTEALFSTDNQYMIGSDLLVRPVTTAGANQALVNFPTKDNWYDVDTNMVVSYADSETGVNSLTVSADIDKIPVYQRGGSIITRKLRLRRSSYMMKTDPYSLYVALDTSKKARGILYMDDEETFAHTLRDEYAVATFSFDGSVISNSVTVGKGWNSKITDLMKNSRMVERIVLMGIETSPSSITSGDRSIDFEYDAVTKVLVLRKPEVTAILEWKIKVF